MATEKTESKDLGSAFDLLGKSYEIVKNNWIPFVVVNILVLLSAVESAIPKKPLTEEESKEAYEMVYNTLSGTDIGLVSGLGLLAILIMLAIYIYLYAMSYVLSTKAAKGEKPSVGELFKDGNKYVLRLIGLGILSALIVFVGLLLLIVPGVIAIGRVIMAPYILVDKNVGVMEALRQSNQMGKTFTGKVWAVIGVSILIAIGTGIIGAIPYIGFIGSLVWIAFSLIVALRYFQLKNLKKTPANSEAKA